MLPLNSPLWSDLSHHFGSAESVPLALQELYECLDAIPIDDDCYKQAVSGLVSELGNMFHQACLCTAINAAMPHILGVLPRLRVEDRIENYFHCGLMHKEGAGWAYEDKQIQEWYGVAVEKAKKDLVQLATDIVLDEDDQFFLFHAVDAFHAEHFCHDIESRWEPEHECRICEAELTFDFNSDTYEVTGPNSKKSTVKLPSNGAQSLFTNDDYKSFLFKIATAGGHQAFATWLGLIHSPFPCPACQENTTMLGS